MKVLWITGTVGRGQRRLLSVGTSLSVINLGDASMNVVLSEMILAK